MLGAIVRGKTRPISLRLDEDIFDAVEKISDEYQINRSEVLREAIDGELDKVLARKNKSVPLETREKILKRLGTIMTNTDQVKKITKNMATNLNQITKKINDGDSSVSKIEVEKYEELILKMTNILEKQAEGLNNIWLTLV